ncbi:MAG: hypothetical protein ABR595_07315 [Psychroflexus sp.]
MKFTFLLILTFFLFSHTTFAQVQEQLAFNRVYKYEHYDCEHPIGIILRDKIQFQNNADNDYFMNIFNSEAEIVNVDLVKRQSFVSSNRFLKNEFLRANKILMNELWVLDSVQAADFFALEERFRFSEPKDTIIQDKTLKHFTIQANNPEAETFKSFHLIVNTEMDSEQVVLNYPSFYFFLSRKGINLKGVLVEQYFINLDDQVYCHDILSAFEIINKRVVVNPFLKP